MTMLNALLSAGLISDKQMTVIEHIKDRVRIINNQLDYLYKKPLNNQLKIINLEEQKRILQGV